jgi:predicted AlkP superfamily pyrophosphatase or phosphodiesterase
MSIFLSKCRSVVGVVFFASALVLSAEARPEHVIIVSLDGGKPAVMRSSPMPVLQTLVAEGAHTWAAQTIDPSVTLPSHTSMLTGVKAEKHKILWNDWRPTNGAVRVSTVFSLAKQKGLTTAMFVGKEKLQHIVVTNSVDRFTFVKNSERISTTNAQGAVATERVPHAMQVASAAAEWIVQARPNVCFIHFPDPDSLGHKYGWGSEQQVQSFAECDAALGIVLNAIKEAGIENKTALIVSADHGGHGRRHGSKMPDDKLIPWIAYGAGVTRNFTITDPVSTCDTMATALWLLNVDVPSSLDGRPVKKAFQPVLSARRNSGRG